MNLTTEASREEVPENCFVFCPLWNICPESDLMIIDGFEFRNNLKLNEVDAYGKRMCHSFLITKLPIKCSDYEVEADFIEASNALAKNVVMSTLTRLRLYWDTTIISGDWEWFLMKTDVPNVSPGQKMSDDLVSEHPNIFTQDDKSKFESFLPGLEEIKPLVDRVAITKFHSSFGREALSDKLIDQMIVFESLFNDSPGDTVAKIVIRSSSLASLRIKNMEDKKVYRQYVYDWVKGAYTLRSDIVHGKKSPDADELSEVIFKVSSILRYLLIDAFALRREKQLDLFGKDKSNGWLIDSVLINSN